MTLPSLGGRAPQPPLRFHRHRIPLGDDEVTRHHGLATTTPACTLLDLAAEAPARAVARALEQAEVLRLVDHAELAALLDRRRTQPGATKLRRLAFTLAEPALTRSELEERFLELLDRHGLPRPRINHRILGHEVDFSWPDHRLIAETDGRRYHATPQAFERDRHRDAQLQRAGYIVVRFNYLQVVTSPERTAATVRDLLRLRCS